MTSHPALNIEIGVHKDLRDSDMLKLSLTQKRADRIKAYFIAQGIQIDRLTAKGYGSTKPIRSKEEQEKLGDDKGNVNRRVEFKIIK